MGETWRGETAGSDFQDGVKQLLPVRGGVRRDRAHSQHEQLAACDSRQRNQLSVFVLAQTSAEPSMCLSWARVCCAGTEQAWMRRRCIQRGWRGSGLEGRSCDGKGRRRIDDEGAIQKGARACFQARAKDYEGGKGKRGTGAPCCRSKMSISELARPARIVFGRNSGPLFSCRSPQAALKFSYRGDRLTRH